MDHYNDPSALARRLEELDKHLKEAADQDERWTEVATAARSLADSLRTRTPEDIHGQLGKSSLPKTLASLVRGSPGVNGAPSRGLRVHALYEVLRVGANLSVDHAKNRDALLEVEFPQSVLALLDSYLPFVRLPSDDDAQSKDVDPLRVDDVRVIKTAIGVLLNTSAGHDAARTQLLSLDAPLIVLRIVCGIYPAGSWASLTSTSSPEDVREEWTWRSGVSNWGWRTLDEWREPSSDAVSESGQPIFGTSSLPYIMASLLSFIPPFPSSPPTAFRDSVSRLGLIEADLEMLEQVCMYLESLSLDVQDVRLMLGKSSASGLAPAEAYLAQIVLFVEEASSPSYWGDVPEKDRKRWDKTLALCKAAVVKSIIAVSGEDENLNLLWPDETKELGGWFVQAMLKWIHEYKPQYEQTEGLDDLAICATLALGNLARKDSHSVALANPPMSVVPYLMPLLDRRIDIKLKHGVIGLLKNMSQSPGNRLSLGNAGVLEALASSQIWESKWDLAETVQLSAIGVSKHLCQVHSGNSFRLVMSSGSDVDSALEQILALTQRSDTVAVKSEGTRVLVNVVKSLCHSTETGGINEEERRKAIDLVVNTRSTTALIELIERSQKYPVLLNEGIVALTLIGSQPAGVSHVLLALFPPDMGTSGTPTEDTVSQTGSAPLSPSLSTSAPVLIPDSRAVRMLVAILTNKEGKYPPELRANVCSLLAAVGRRAPNVDVKRQEALRNQTWDTIHRVADGPETGTIGKVSLKKAAATALEAWR